MKMRKKHTSAASGDCGRGGVSDGHGDTRDGGNLRDDGGGRAVMKVRARQEQKAAAWKWRFVVSSK